MATAKSPLLSLLCRSRIRSKVAASSFSASKRALVTVPARKYYHSSPPFQQDVSSQQPTGSPIADSVKANASPTRGKSPAADQAPENPDENRNAAFLGEADSDDGFEADVETNPEAYRHNFDDVAASGLHGQSGEGDEPIERQQRDHGPIDGTNSAYLGEADSNDALEADREANPDKYRHNISDSSNAAFLGEADSDDAHEADREAQPEEYRHRIEDAGVSGQHGEAGEGDENIPRGAKGRRFV